MKVFNITDASTAALRNQGLENLPFKVGETIITPGTYGVIRGTAREISELQPLLKKGAAALDELPVWYASKRGLSIDGTPLVVEAPAVEEAPSE